jgi:hypothetical protein
MDSSETRTVAVSTDTALALKHQVEEQEADLTTTVSDLIQAHLKDSVDSDVRTDAAVDGGVPVAYRLTDRQESMIAAISDDSEVDAFVRAALETRIESTTASIDLQLPGTIITALDALVDAGVYHTRSDAVEQTVMDDERLLPDFTAESPSGVE